MNGSRDRLYELLPVAYRQRDVERDAPLRALLHVIAEQVNLVETDIAQLYENWFIETCEDWVVPYIGELIGYQPVHEAGEPGEVSTLQGRQRNKILIPRREGANTIRYRRRKGTLALLELLANDVAAWPARAVELSTLLAWTQAINQFNDSRLDQGRSVDLRRGDALERLNGPFDELAHTLEVRRMTSRHSQGRYNIPSVGLFVWRLQTYALSQTPAYCLEEVGPHCYTFSVLGNDLPLYTRPEPEEEPTHIAEELNLPLPIRRRSLETHKSDYYGEGKSLQIWEEVPRQPISAERIVVADLSDWQYRPRHGQVAVDPVLGRLAFPPRELPRWGIWVSYHYGLSADIGGGEYNRSLAQPGESVLYQVGEQQELKRINDALVRWQEDKPPHAVIEITDSGVYVEQINVQLGENQNLQLRAANRTRPIIRLLDWQTDRPDALSIKGEPGSCFTLDGLLITGRGVQIQGNLADVIFRHVTLVPGWTLHPDCEPRRPAEPSLALFNTQACISIEHSIVGSIQVNQDQVATDPILIRISDSVLDATGPDREALGAPGWPLAHAILSIVRSTVFGQMQTHAIELAENSIFSGLITVGRRQRGCMRFCYVTPGSRTPRRYNCQPDLVEKPIKAQFERGQIDAAERDRALARERLRVRPQFNSTRYGTPTYCQLAEPCAEEITRGADDESELGVFHDLYQPQRAANLHTRLEEYTPAGMEAGIMYAS